MWVPGNPANYLPFLSRLGCCIYRPPAAIFPTVIAHHNEALHRHEVLRGEVLHHDELSRCVSAIAKTKALGPLYLYIVV